MKKIISLLLVAMLALSSAVAVNAEGIRDVFSTKAESVSARGASDSGTWESLQWSYDNGVLTITGTGEMPNVSGSVGFIDYLDFDLTSLVIGSGITSVSFRAFPNCEELTSVTLPDTIKVIGEGAFDGCVKLTSINIPASVESIGADAFANCDITGKLVIPEGVKTIGSRAFCDSPRITHITIPSTVTSIGERAFYAFDPLERLRLTCNSTSATLEQDIVNSTIDNLSVMCPSGSTMQTYFSENGLDYVTHGTTQTVTLNTNGGSFPDSSTTKTINKTFDSDLTLPRTSEYIPTRSGYFFCGWALTSDANADDMDRKYAYDKNASTLYAIWNPKIFSAPELTNSTYSGDSNAVSGYSDTKTENDNGLSGTWAKQSAKWINSSTGNAELRVDFSYRSDSVLKSRDVFLYYCDGFTPNPTNYIASLAGSILKEFSNNRVYICGQTDENVHLGSGWLTDFDDVLDYVAEEKEPAYTAYGICQLLNAYNQFENRTDKSRDPMCIYLVPVNASHIVWSQENLANLQTTGAQIALMTDGTPISSSTQEAFNRVVSSPDLYIELTNPSDFATTFSNLFKATAMRDYKIKVNLDTQRFTTSATAPSGGSYAGSSVTISDNVITWDVSSLSPDTQYYITLPIQLVSNPVSGGPRGASYTFPTSLEGNSIASVMNKSNDMVVNTIDSPVLTMDSELPTPPVHILLDHNGGTNSVDEFWFQQGDYAIYNDSACADLLDADGYIDAPTKTGYVCNGYKKDGTTYISHNGICEDDMYTLPSETTLTAEWTPIGYTVYYNPNGSGVEGDTANSTHEYDVAKELTPNGYTRSGYTFSSWNTQPDGTGTKYFDKQSVINLTTKWADKVHLYAQWTPVNIIHIILDHNGGTNSVDEFWFQQDDYAIYNDSACADLLNADGFIDAPTKTGYVCNGYKKDGTTYISHNGICEDDMYTLPSETTLTAEWTPIGYTVYYNPNGSGVEGDTANSSHTYDVAKELTPNGYTRPGYRFVNWNTDPDGTGTKYLDKQSVINLTTESADRVHLYAQWEEVTYTLTANANGGSISSTTGWTGTGTTSTKSITYGSTYGTLPTVSRTGYTLTGWLGKPNLFDMNQTAIYPGYYIDVNGNKVVNAEFSVYKINVSPNTQYTLVNSGMSGTPSYVIYNSSNQKVAGEAYNSRGTITFTTPATASYVYVSVVTLAGNYRYDKDKFRLERSDMTGSFAVTSSTTVSKAYSHQIVAQWTINTYKVTVKPNGGTWNYGGTNYTTDTDISLKYNGSFSVNPPSRTGYTFDNWTVVGEGSSLASMSGDVKLFIMGDEDATMTANWTPITYTVAYNANGGTGRTANSTHTYDVAKALTTNGFTRDGYTFTGWNTKEDGTGTSYTDKQSVINLASTNGATVQLYAKWEAVPQKTSYIRYYDGSTLLQETVINDGETTHKLTETPIASAEEGLPVRNGYLFGGWYTTNLTLGTTNGTAFPQNITIADYADADGNLNLYAAWVPVGTVTKDGNDKNSYGASSLKGFSLEGVQIRSKEVADKYQPGMSNTDQDALRFVTVYRNGMLEELQGLNGKSVSYGYTAYAKTDIANLTKLNKKTTGAVDIDCTKEGDQNHRMFDDYRLSTLVIKYDGADSAYKGDLVEARAYVDYTDANGFGRRGYHTYSDSKFAGGCRTSFDSAWSAVSQAYDALAKVA